MWRVCLVLVACGNDNYGATPASRSAVVVMPPIGKPTEPANDRCTVDTDCVLAFPPTDPCCPNSGAPLAMTADHKAKLVPLPEKTCSQDVVVACKPRLAQDLWPDAVCNNHACIAEPHVTPVFDPSPFSRACAVDADCALVERDPCNPCRCASYGIAAAQRGRYLEAFGVFKANRCKRRDHEIDITITPCVHCDEVAPVCNHGTCDTKSTEPVPTGGECASDADCVISCASTEKCCETGPCEDVVSKTRLAEILAAQPTGCKAVRCRAPNRPKYITPRCKVGKCFGEVESRLPGH